MLHYLEGIANLTCRIKNVKSGSEREVRGPNMAAAFCRQRCQEVREAGTQIAVADSTGPGGARVWPVMVRSGHFQPDVAAGHEDAEARR